MDTDYCYKRNEKIVCRDVDGVPALIDPYRRALLKLNPTALRIWQLLDGGRPVTAIIGMLEEEYDVDARGLEKDVIAFLSGLFRREMIQ